MKIWECYSYLEKLSAARQCLQCKKLKYLADMSEETITKPVFPMYLCLLLFPHSDTHHKKSPLYFLNGQCCFRLSNPWCSLLIVDAEGWTIKFQASAERGTINRQYNDIRISLQLDICFQLNIWKLLFYLTKPGITALSQLLQSIKQTTRESANRQYSKET